MKPFLDNHKLISEHFNNDLQRNINIKKQSKEIKKCTRCFGTGIYQPFNPNFPSEDCICTYGKI